jgi:hypothetical protein
MSVVCLAGIQVLSFCLLSSAFASRELVETPLAMLDQYRSQLVQLSSDDEALSFFHSTRPPQVKGLRTHTQSPSAPSTQAIPEETKQAVSTYLASLAVIAHTRNFRQTIGTLSPASPPPSESLPGDDQLQWLGTPSPLQTLKSVVNFYKQVYAWSHLTAQPLSPETDFAKFAAYYDQTYPEWGESPLSWTSIFQLHGEKGIEARLSEYWQDPGQQSSKQTTGPSKQSAYAQLYIERRLLPLFRADLLSQIVRLETTAYETAWENWQNIQQWEQQEQTKSATARLCGTWHWIVHNHQNHGDHKMTITFSPPGQSSPSQPEPTTIAIQGDTVYLKWTFPRGIQEDSLLISNHDTRLEGTFKNSLGPHGSISGKRLSTCGS